MISIRNLSLTMSGFELKDISLDIQQGECFVIVGPTGSGKSVLLETIAGFHRRLERGEIWIDGREVSKLPPEKRSVGYVPQDYVLFPHLNVKENIAFGLKTKNTSIGAAAVENMMKLLDITHLSSRDVKTLSGGEKQRVAVARALMTNPKLLLLDEPLSALDGRTRERLQRELKRIYNGILLRLGVASIYVTHDLIEAYVMGDSIAIINNGMIEQAGRKEEVIQRPKSAYTAEFMGLNFYTGKVISSSNGLVDVEINGIHICAEKTEEITKPDALVTVRPEDVTLSEEKSLNNSRWCTCTCNILPGVIKDIVEMKSYAKIITDVGFTITSEITIGLLKELELRPGSKTYVQFKASSVNIS